MRQHLDILWVFGWLLVDILPAGFYERCRGETEGLSKVGYEQRWQAPVFVAVFVRAARAGCVRD